ncbi:hypothetical protein [Streptomyces sp. NPDC021622]|uniref:hypothetical protein n=1 Tax=Streptomyces sp. NPDC021622 TaxID=3155013 RepID=UPI0033E31832
MARRLILDTGLLMGAERDGGALAGLLNGVRALIPIEDYTADVARVHARLLAHVRREGKPRGAHDLIIAATAATTARELLTTDGKAAFDDLPGVRSTTH